ncbi:MAG: hypothetical protein OHK0045_13070 [Raineya sp.]
MNFILAQDTTNVDELPPIDNFDNYGDAQATKRFCTQKVRNLTPTKLYSVGYEVQGPFTMSSKVGEDYRNNLSLSDSPSDVKVQAVHGLQLGVNYPIISKSSVIVSLTAQYAESRFIVEDTKGYSFYRNLNDQGIRTGGIGTVIFKPLNEKKFMIFQLQGDINGTFGFNQIGTGFSNGLTISGAAIYGWKKSDDFMWGLGVTRTYRGGEALHIPIVYYNRTFNDRWGTEILFPARIHFRRNFSPKALLQLGYEIVGNSYHIQNIETVGNDLRPYDDLQLRRSEIKIRAIYERSLKNFIWISIQGGLRYNYKFNLSEANGVRSEGLINNKFLLENTIGNPLYFNVSLNLVSP